MLFSVELLHKAESNLVFPIPNEWTLHSNWIEMNTELNWAELSFYMCFAAEFELVSWCIISFSKYKIKICLCRYKNKADLTLESTYFFIILRQNFLFSFFFFKILIPGLKESIISMWSQAFALPDLQMFLLKQEKTIKEKQQKATQ